MAKKLPKLPELLERKISKPGQTRVLMMMSFFKTESVEIILYLSLSINGLKMKL